VAQVYEHSKYRTLWKTLTFVEGSDVASWWKSEVGVVYLFNAAISLSPCKMRDIIHPLRKERCATISDRKMSISYQY
jgi:hypothetical protein